MNEQEIQAHKAQLMSLTEKLLQAAEGVNHSLLLDALMTLYVTVAKSHSCCTQSAVHMCMNVATHLKNAGIARPESVPLH